MPPKEKESVQKHLLKKKESVQKAPPKEIKSMQDASPYNTKSHQFLYLEKILTWKPKKD